VGDDESLLKNWLESEAKDFCLLQQFIK